jgi:multidrug efflux pump subunit AcrB
MLGDLTSAFGFTVILCLAPSLLIALIFPPILMRMTRPTTKPTKPGEKPKPRRRNFIMAAIAYGQFYFVSLIVIVGLCILFWWGFIAFNGEQAAADFAAQSFPVEEEALEDIIEPQLTPESSDGS